MEHANKYIYKKKHNDMKKERNRLRAAVTKANGWPTSKQDKIKRHFREFSKFNNSIPFEELHAL
jgi:pterin-4a-carbinolamine dehydratase